MEYKVIITPQAQTQLAETVNYISEVLLAPETAVKWLDVLEKAIYSLNTMPNRFPLTDEEPWKTRGIRKLIVKGFIVYYLVDDSRNAVFITAVIYGKRNQIAALKQLED